MILVKKLAVAPVFLVSLTALFFFISPLLQSAELIFSPDLQTLYKLVALSALILASALTFTIFGSFALDWKLVLPVIIISIVPAILFFPFPLNLVLSSLVIISLVLSYLNTENRMRSYLNFQASTLLNPSVKQLAGLLILTLSVTYYLSINKLISEKGFEIPDSLIDSTLKLIPQPNIPVQGFKYGSTNLIAQMPQLTQEQIELLKQNPELLKQYGIDPKTLDSLPTPPAQSQQIPYGSGSRQTDSALNPAAELVKPMIKEQLQNMLNPYQKFIPAILALFLFLTLQSLVSFLCIFLSPTIWLIYFILEKINFIHFESEMREVRKMVV